MKLITILSVFIMLSPVKQVQAQFKISIQKKTFGMTGQLSIIPANE